MEGQLEISEFNSNQRDSVRLKHLARVNPPKTEVSELPSDTEVSFVPLEDFGTDGEIHDTETKSLDDVYSGYTYFREGDIAIAKITPSFENGKGAICEGLENGIGFGTTELHILRPREKTNNRFLWYVLRSKLFRDEAEAAMRGVAGQQRVPTEFVENYRAHYASLDEQQKIVAFLDHHIAQIDSLIGQKQQLLARLSERQHILTSQTVTQGLEPKSEMKSSGVPGIGKIPQDWDMVPLKYSSPEITVGIVRKPSQYYVEDGVPALRSLNVKPSRIIEEDLVYISEEANANLSGSRLRAGDLVAVRSGDPGTTAVVPERLDGANCIDLIIIRRPNGYLPEFLSLLMNSEIARRQIEFGTEGALQQHFNVEEVNDLIFPKPPLDKQKQILEWLSPQQSTIDQLQAEVQDGIELLKEKRQALITKAVTGQIDVTDRQPEQEVVV